MRKWLIKVLYESLDDWAKWEIFGMIKRPTIDQVLAEQGKQADKLFR